MLIILTYIIGLSKLLRSMSELAVLLKWALPSFREMFAHLSLVFLFECVDLSLVSIEVIVVWLIGEDAEHFAWWVVEVAWSAVGVETLALISSLLRLGAGGTAWIRRLSGSASGSLGRFVVTGRATWRLIAIGRWRLVTIALFNSVSLLGCLEVFSFLLSGLSLFVGSLWQAIGATDGWHVAVCRHFLVLIWNL